MKQTRLKKKASDSQASQGMLLVLWPAGTRLMHKFNVNENGPHHRSELKYRKPTEVSLVFSMPLKLFKHQTFGFYQSTKTYQKHCATIITVFNSQVIIKIGQLVHIKQNWIHDFYFLLLQNLENSCSRNVIFSSSLIHMYTRESGGITSLLLNSWFSRNKGKSYNSDQTFSLLNIPPTIGRKKQLLIQCFIIVISLLWVFFLSQVQFAMKTIMETQQQARWSSRVSNATLPLSMCKKTIFVISLISVS